MVFWSILVVATVLLLIYSPRGLLHLRHLQQKHRSLTQKNLVLEQQNRRLYQEITRLRREAAIEHLARQELGLIGEDELIIYFNSPGTESQ